MTSTRLSVSYRTPGSPGFFQNSVTADFAYWVMDHTFTKIAGGLLNPYSPGSPAWKFMALENLNGDGQPDIIFQNSQTGVVGYWLMNGFTKTQNGLFSPGNPGNSAWQAVGVY
ncbi:MAG TPA: hypothetical protein VGS41_17085 [Chthonomonadales bacterium]|nr:hypothetical protein [Chthonomonadales bacterium]